MWIANHTRILIQEEGITTVGYLVEFNVDNILRQVIKNCKRPLHEATVGGGALILHDTFYIVETFLMRIKVITVEI